ncbi:MAG: YgiT-type zinc finger protein [Desulfurellaceae bacterium]|nr:YgiT-type zinc finger protein [Desulfurellaceae bacterium]
MNCIHCQGQMEHSNAPFHIDRKGYHLVFDTVPAWVCEQCGEAYFEEREVNAIQAAIQGLDQQARQLSAGLESA